MTSRPSHTLLKRLMAKSAHARRGLRTAAHPAKRPFLATYDDTDDLDIPDAALGPDKTTPTQSP